MTQQESPFDNYPIEFKEINPEDFASFSIEEKTIITPNDEGYINEALQDHIDLNEKDTTVINAGVGQGKTYSVIQIVQAYYEAEEFITFIVAPYVSLISQYYKQLIAIGIPESSIFRYEELGNEACSNYLQKSIHIVTANCLLGNPGEDALINSLAKRTYLQQLSKHCIDNQKNTIFIYDEIHDTIHNFKEKYVFNLWKWKDTIHKNFLVSATYNEASKIVIGYMAELTDNKIHIIESKRERQEERQSELYLHYNQNRSYQYDDDTITSLIYDLIENDKNIDILTFSKRLAEDIIDNKEDGIGSLLYKKYEKINNCTSELIKNQRTFRTEPQNRFNPDMCNVGTNFKTGISIVKDNHAFVIIMPPNGCKMPFQNNYGIFSGGINAIIQALARQRKKGEIHIILPKPSELDYTTLPFYSDVAKRDFFIERYDKIKFSQVDEEKVKYFSLNSQHELLHNFYENEMKEAVRNEIERVQATDRETLTRLLYPEFGLFKLNDGESYLSNKIPFFGGDLSSYITYCAITNQFINCKLKTIHLKPVLFFEEGKIQKGLTKYLEILSINTDRLQSLYQYLNDYYFYIQFREDLFDLYQIKIKGIDGKWENAKPNGTSRLSKLFEQQLLGFIQRFLYKNTSYNITNYYNQRKLIDGEYTRGQYLLECIHHAEKINVLESQTEAQRKRILAYKFLASFKNQMISSIKTTTVSRAEIQYLESKPDAHFIEAIPHEEFMNTIEYLKEKDEILSSGLYEFKRRFEGKAYINQLNTLYNIIREDLFETTYYKLPSGSRKNVHKILGIKEIHSDEKVINLILKPDYKNLPEHNTPNEFLPTPLI